MVRYEERSPTRRSWLILLVVCVVGWVGLSFGEGGWVIATILVGIVGGIAAITMWSTGLYGNIRLTDSELRVGRSRVPLADLYPWGVPENAEQGRAPLAGGALAPTLGANIMELHRRNGTRFRVQSKNPDALRAALDEALTPFR
ncbi:DUF3093 family protein [Cellulomonas sp. URHE0023]|uniref:DUF3093 family protein n=1 Tax=Cellulomonas sp. URHE0023 TaxID=1380354 RepID=UPI0004843320|nr:DUF3093 family protein [Cellulomonas sp. URHE0023]